MTSGESAGAINPQTGSSGNPQTGEPFEHAPTDAHKRLDRKDERTHAQTIEDAHRAEKLEKQAEEEHAEALRHPTEIAKSHGNEPSRGAKIDEQIAAEEEELLKKMDEKKN